MIKHWTYLGDGHLYKFDDDGKYLLCAGSIADIEVGDFCALENISFNRKDEKEFIVKIKEETGIDVCFAPDCQVLTPETFAHWTYSKKSDSYYCLFGNTVQYAKANQDGSISKYSFDKYTLQDDSYSDQKKENICAEMKELFNLEFFFQEGPYVYASDVCQVAGKTHHQYCLEKHTS